jgi:hypothetical protein
MARVPKKEWGREFRKKKADQKHEFSTMDGTEYILYAPNFKQQEAYENSLTTYKDVFDRIKEDIKEDATIAKSRDGFPKDFDHVEWAAILSSTLKKLNKTWSKSETKGKIWIYNKNYDGTTSVPMYLAIKPKITQRNAKRGARKASAAADDDDDDDDDDGYIDAANITFGPRLPPLTRRVYTRTKNGLTYYYNTEEDAENYNHYKIENSDEELVNESGERINPDGTLMKFIRKSEDEAEDDYQYEGESEEPNYYDEDNPPDDEAIWDDEFKSWVYPLPPEMYEMYDEKDNVEPEPEPEPELEPPPMSMPAQAPIQQQESRIDQLKRRRRARAAAALMTHAKNPQPDVVMPPPAPMLMPPPAPQTDAERIAEASIGLPAGWEPLISRSTGKMYYRNKNTGNKQYEVPTDDPRIVEASIGLPAGWVPLISRSTGKIYFYNQNNGVKQVERPTMGGKRTRRRPRAKSRAKKPKKKRTTTRRKRTTTTRRRK